MRILKIKRSKRDLINEEYENYIDTKYENIKN
jgi:hypothetical protein